MAIARRLTRSGLIDFLNVIRGHIDNDEALSRVIPGMGERSAPHLDFAGEVRAETRLPTFHAARIQDVATARHAIKSGKLDMVGMTRAHLADPHIASKVAEGREAEIRPCVGMGYCNTLILRRSGRLHSQRCDRPQETIPHVVPRSRAEKKGGRRRRVGRRASKRRAWATLSAGTKSSSSEAAGPSRAGRSCSPPRLGAGARSWASSGDWRVRECEAPRRRLSLRFTRAERGGSRFEPDDRRRRDRRSAQRRVPRLRGAHSRPPVGTSSRARRGRAAR